MAAQSPYPASAPDILRGMAKQLRDLVPSGWVVAVDAGARVGDANVDALLSIATAGGERAKFVVEVRREPPAPGIAEAAALRLATALAKAGPSSSGWERVVVAPYLSPGARERLIQLGVCFVDLTGNIRIASERPATAITSSGADKAPRSSGGGLAGMSGRAALQVARALVDIDFTLPVTTDAIAAEAGVSVSQAWRVVELLDSEGIVQRDSRGRLAAYEWRGVLTRLMQDYSYQRRGKPAAYLTLQGADRALAALPNVMASERVAVTGSQATQVYAPLAPPRSLELWADSPDAIAEALGAVPADGASDLRIAAPFAPVVFDRSRMIEGVTYCNPSQVAADMWNEPGRGRSQAEAIIEWMTRDDTWRS